MADWAELVKRSHGRHHTTRWVFASTRRIGGDPTNPDVSVNGSSLAPPERHACRRLLGRPPAVWLHLVRSVAGNFLDSAPGMRPSASSLMLAHTMPASADEVAPTTRKFYLSNQRMDVKTAAIAAWAGAVMDATPRPGASPRCRGSERKPDASAIGISSLTHTQQMLKILTHTHPFIGFVGYRTSS